MKVAIKSDRTVILYLVLLMAFANASLRFNAAGYSSWYRLISPIVFFYIVLVGHKRLINAMVFFAIAFIYSIFVSTIYYHNVFINYHINLIYIMVCYVIVFRLKNIEKDFDDTFFSFLDKTTVVILVLAFLQLIIHKPYPFVLISANRTAVNLFFSNENELGEPMACMVIIYMVRQFVKKEKKHLVKILLIFLLLFLNDAKLSLLGAIVGLLLTGVFIRSSKRDKKVKGGNIKLFIGIGIVASIVTFLSISNVNLRFRDYDINFNSLIMDYIKHIVRLESFSSGGGSMIDRTNAIIFGLRELRNSHFFGIGFGNSTYMMSMPQYKTLTAESMHNIFFQVICEFGYLAIIGYLLIGRQVLKNIRDDANWINVLKLVYCISFILISSQSSIGILSNYMTWTITFYVALFGNKEIMKKDCYYAESIEKTVC